MTFVPPNNEAIWQTLVPPNAPTTNRAGKAYVSPEQLAYNGLRVAADKLGEQHMDTRVCTEFMREYLINASNRKQLVDKMLATYHAQNPGKQRVDRETQVNIAQAEAAMSKQFTDNFMQNVLPKYGEEGAKTWKAFAEATQPKGFFDGITSQFFENGKFKLSGIVGALAVGGTTLASGVGGPGIMGWVAPIVAAMAGGWAGNKVTEMLDQHAQGKTSTFPGDTPGKHLQPLVPNHSHDRQRPLDHLTPQERERALAAGHGARNSGAFGVDALGPIGTNSGLSSSSLQASRGGPGNNNNSGGGGLGNNGGLSGGAYGKRSSRG